MDKIVSRRKFVRAFFTKLASKITEPGREGDVTEFRVKIDSLKEKCRELADLDASVFESLVSADVEPQEDEVIEEMEAAQSYQDSLWQADFPSFSRNFSSWSGISVQEVPPLATRTHRTVTKGNFDDRYYGPNAMLSLAFRHAS
ncbi:hypothetical protein GE061_000089 [Apolygus lucorum]|uniref:Uncharacterized protein n=1 Tax=Apolygus lucorum TaxID=248454 RepID=A0A8S9Y5Z3_APOLU|nr:hypothetical protein GE061_000089 [Apolygus lucorum]